MVDEKTLEATRAMLGYTDDQWETWKRNPRNHKVVENFGTLEKYKVVAEITHSEGCAAGYKVGDRIVYGADGTLLRCKENPEKICSGLLTPVNPLIEIVFDNIAAGKDPTDLAFGTVHCVDIGVDHGGWGEVIADVKVVEA
jgi:hypothetical protein